MRKKIKENPWMKIPPFDYENHMNSPNVDQLSFLSGLFLDSLNNFDCNLIAMLGAATGNGLEHIKNENTSKVTVIDINPEYLKILKSRFEMKILGLEIINADLEILELNECSYSLIFAGLIFEYLNPGVILTKIFKWLQKGGVCVVILQLRVKNSKKISETPFKKLKLLDPFMNLVDPNYFRREAENIGLNLIRDSEITLHTGKSFYTGYFQKY